MEAERRWSVKDPLATNDDSQRPERRCQSTLKIAASGPTQKLLDEETTFPNISKPRQQWLQEVFFKGYYAGKRGCATIVPDPLPPVEEYDIRPYLDAESPIYTQSFLDVPVVGVGKQLNVLDFLGDSLLSFNTSSSQNVPSIRPTSTSSTTPREENAKVESALNLKGKYVMICCVFVPSMWSSSDGPMIYRTALASHELAKRDDFVLVVVPMMRTGFVHSSSAYQHFLSGFSCLAVPFHDILRREYICSALGFDGKPKAVIIDPSQKVLYLGLPDMFCLFGGADPDFFPFTRERVEKCLSRDDVLQYRSLNEVLGLGDTDALYDIEYLAGGGLKEDGCITVSELKQKFVGIYVYSDGTSLSMLQEVYEECKRREHELEIVVGCFPFLTQVPPKTEEKFIIDALASLGLLRWWFFPFNNTVCHRLQQMRERDSGEEGLFMVDPIGKYVDRFGMAIIRDFGMDGYPFTRRKLVEKEVERKMGLTVNSLLRHWTHVCCKKLDSGSSIVKVPVAQALKNKIVVLYLYEQQCKSLADELGAWYKNNIKGKVSNVEVVTVSLDGIECDDDKDFFMDMGWLVCPADPSKAAKVRDEYCHPCCRSREILVVFGEDGRIQSVDASQLLESQGPPPRGGDLRAQIGSQFARADFHYMWRFNSM